MVQVEGRRFAANFSMMLLPHAHAWLCMHPCLAAHAVHVYTAVSVFGLPLLALHACAVVKVASQVLMFLQA